MLMKPVKALRNMFSSMSNGSRTFEMQNSLTDNAESIN